MCASCVVFTACVCLFPCSPCGFTSLKELDPQRIVVVKQEGVLGECPSLFVKATTTKEGERVLSRVVVTQQWLLPVSVLVMMMVSYVGISTMLVMSVMWSVSGRSSHRG